MNQLIDDVPDMHLKPRMRASMLPVWNNGNGVVQTMHDSSADQAWQQEQKERRREESIDQQHQMREVQIKLEASEQREGAKSEELQVMARAQASLQKAREVAIVEANDARERLRQVEAQLVLSEAEILRERKAREEVQEEMEF
jgi:hypothetical protein